MTNTYTITHKGVEVYRYQCDGDPLTFDEYPSPEFVQELVPAVPVLVYDGRRKLSRYEFLSLYTPQERIEIRSSADPVIVDIQEMLNIAIEVDLDNPVTQQSVGYLAMTGLIQPARVPEILRG
jgi:hypothetical protein